MTRRRLLQLLGVTSLGASLSGCRSLEQRFTETPLPSDAFSTPSAPVRPAVRLLNRLAYGPKPGEAARVEKMGIAAYVDEQLNPEKMDEDPAAQWRVRRLNDILTGDAGLLFDVDDKRVIAALRQATTLRAVYSRRQLQERMVEFWGDHFNIYAFKGSGSQFKAMDDRETTRKHALGSFGDLLRASAQSAAMLGYLDNTSNRKGVPNENYARELMELHTLGVDGGYTQKDVKEVARCLSGWTSERHWHRGRFFFDAANHDNGAKHVLGVPIAANGGVKDGERVLDILAAHPATARHVSRKLCVHFLGDAPASWVKRLSQIYLATHGNIAALLRPLLTSPDLLTARPILKRPFDFAVSALRAFHADTDGGEAVQNHLEAMGQPLFAWPMPDGYPDHASSWTGALLSRWNFAAFLTGAPPNADTHVNFEAVASAARHNHLPPHDALLELAFGLPSDAPELSALRARQALHPDLREWAALILMSPDFQWR